MIKNRFFNSFVFFSQSLISTIIKSNDLTVALSKLASKYFQKTFPINHFSDSVFASIFEAKIRARVSPFRQSAIPTTAKKLKSAKAENDFEQTKWRVLIRQNFRLENWTLSNIKSKASSIFLWWPIVVFYKQLTVCKCSRSYFQPLFISFVQSIQLKGN